MLTLRFSLLSLLCGGLLLGQTAMTGGIRGTLTDDRGGRSIPGATITVKNPSLSLKQDAKTDDQGRFRVLGLPPAADYEIVVAAAGFETGSRQDIAVNSTETAIVDIQVAVASRNDSVTVEANAGALVNDRPEVSQTIGPRQLTELATSNRNLNRFATLDPHVRNTSPRGGDSSNQTRLSINGMSFRDTRYKIDGNVNYDALFNNAPLQTISLSAVQEFKVLTNAFAADQGNTSTGILIATTKSGTDEFHGEALFFGRPSGIQARAKLAPFRGPNEQEQWGGSLGGPLVKGQTYFFANYEGSRQNRGAYVFPPYNAFFVGKFEEHLGLFRLDHRFSDAHLATLRMNGARNANNNVNDRVSGFSQPSTAQNYHLQSLGAQLNDTLTFGANKINELRLSYINAVPGETTPVISAPVIVRPNYSTEGIAALSSQRAEVYQISDQISVQAGSHSVRFGGDFIRRKVRDFQYQQFGTYRFAPGPPTPGQLPISFTQQLGQARMAYGQTQWAGFVQDDWRATPHLTLNLGVRYEYQSITNDLNNFAPRLGFAYDLLGKGRTTLRGSAGLFYDQPFFHGLTQKYLLDAPTALTPSITLVPGDAAFPVFPNSLSLSMPVAPYRRNIDLPSHHLLNPYTSQFTFGIQQRIGRDWVATADVIHNGTVKQIQAFNLNAPAPFVRTTAGQIRPVAVADATRPFTTYAGVPVFDVLQAVNSGTATYSALDLGISKRYSHGLQAEAHYVYSSALNNVTDDHLGANPNEWSNVGHAERGPSDFYQRHRLVAHGVAALPYKTQFSLIATLASGLPVNPLTGFDNNGDRNAVDRPAGFGRNSFRGPRQTTFDASLSKNLYLRERTRIELRADVLNLFNGSNYFVLNNVYGNGSAPLPTFLQPLPGISNVDPSRQYQFGIRLLF